MIRNILDKWIQILFCHALCNLLSYIDSLACFCFELDNFLKGKDTILTKYLLSTKLPGGGHGNPFQYSCLENPPWTEEPGGLQSIGSQRARHD